jgi:hypothetical protein
MPSFLNTEGLTRRQIADLAKARQLTDEMRSCRDKEFALGTKRFQITEQLNESGLTWKDIAAYIGTTDQALYKLRNRRMKNSPTNN